jgi:hypothetical protein
VMNLHPAHILVASLFDLSPVHATGIAHHCKMTSYPQCVLLRLCLDTLPRRLYTLP